MNDKHSLPTTLNYLKMHKLTSREMGEKWICMCIYICSLMKSMSSKWEMAVITLTSKALALCLKKTYLHP